MQHVNDIQDEMNTTNSSMPTLFSDIILITMSENKHHQIFYYRHLTKCLRNHTALMYIKCVRTRK